jgi:LPS-assembly protein
MSGLLAVAALSVTAGLRAQEIPCAAEQARSPAPHTTAAEKADVAASRDDRISIEADGAELGVKGNTDLKGNVVIKQGDREIRANDAQYTPDDTALKIEGELEYLDPVVHVQGRRGNYSQSTGAEFKDAQFELRQRAARGTAGELSVTPQGIVNLEQVNFTTCPREDEAWRISAKSISLDTRSKIGTGRNARVEFKGVPIIYLPWMSFPLGNERKSGFLFPSLGHSTRSGFEFSVPYYWNIAPQADLTFEPVYYALRGADVAGQFRYLTQKQRGALQFNYLPNDQKADDSRYRFAIDHIAELPRDFRLTVNAATVSDHQYFEDFAQGPEGTSVPFVERFAQLQYRDEHWMLAAELQNFQTLLATVETIAAGDEFTEADKPYSRLPRLVASGDFGWGPAQRLRYGFDSELVNFHRPFGITGWRFDAMPGATLSLGNSAYFVRPSIAWRTTQYELDHTSPDVDDSPSRSLPIASLDAGMIFERPSGSRQQRIMTLEPRLLYLYVPYRGQDALPVFDTALPDLSLIQLFRTNRYVGADRVSDANQVSLGVTSRLLSASSGQQYLSATFGQIFYFETPRVHLPDETPREGKDSDLVAQISLTAFKNWNADIGLQRNLEDTSKERAQVRLQYRPGPQKVVNASYRFQRDRLEQGEISAAWPLSKHWNLFTRYVHSFDDNKALERFAGLEYSSCCWRLRVLGRRFITNRGEPGSNSGEQDTGIYLQLELTGLASVGSAADAFLSNAIRGYSRDEPPR